MDLFKNSADPTKKAAPEVEELEARVNFLAEINKAINMKENRVDVISQDKSGNGWEFRVDINLDPFRFIADADGHIQRFEEVTPAKKKKGLFRR